MAVVRKAGTPQPQQSQQPPPQQPPPQSGYRVTMRGNAKSPIPLKPGSAYTHSVVKVLKDIYSGVDRNIHDIKVLALDNSVINTLLYSFVCVLMTRKDIPDAVSAYTLILKQTGDGVAPFRRNIAGQEIVVDRYAGDAFDTYFVDLLRDEVKNLYKDGINIYLVDAMVLQEDVNVEDQLVMQRIAAHAAIATDNQLLIKSQGFQDFNIAVGKQDGVNESLVADVRPQFDNLIGVDCLPCIETHRISLSLATNVGNTQHRRNGVYDVNNPTTTEQTLTQVSVFPDIIFKPTVPLNPYAQQPMQRDTRCFALRVVISDILHKIEYTPSTLLLSILSVKALYLNNSYYQLLKEPPLAPNETSTRSIGALNVQANLMNSPEGFGKVIGTNGSDFGNSEFVGLIQQMFLPGFMVAVDVPTSGPITWITSILRGASDNPGGGATQVLLKAANDLTNNHFQNYFKSNSPLFMDNDNIIHAGYYIGEDGRKRDLREIDYLLVANVNGSSRPGMLQEYADTFLDRNTLLQVRLQNRKNMIMDITNGTAVFTGTFTRVTFSKQFLECIESGITMAGLDLIINTAVDPHIYVDSRGGYSDWVNDALSTTGVKNPFKYGSNAGSNTPGLQVPNFRNW